MNLCLVTFEVCNRLHCPSLSTVVTRVIRDVVRLSDLLGNFASAPTLPAILLWDLQVVVLSTN